MGLLPAEYGAQGVVPIGRLDQDSCGLLLLTNDGDLIQGLLHPSKEVWKTYRVVVRGEVTKAKLTQLESGTVIDGRETRRAKVRLLDERKPNETEIEVSISEGRKRQIRRMCRKAGLQVEYLQRVAFGPIRLGKLPESRFRVLSTKEVRALQEAGGL